MQMTEFNGYYGRNTPTTILCAVTRVGTWYVCGGGEVVNFTYDEIGNGTNVETLSDADCFTWNEPINTLDELEAAIDA